MERENIMYSSGETDTCQGKKRRLKHNRYLDFMKNSKHDKRITKI